MIRVYDKDGKEHYHHYAVDAREAIKGGHYFARNPKISPAPPPPPPEVPAMGEDIGRNQEFEETPTTSEPEFEDTSRRPIVQKEPEFEEGDPPAKRKKRG